MTEEIKKVEEKITEDDKKIDKKEMTLHPEQLLSHINNYKEIKEITPHHEQLLFHINNYKKILEKREKDKKEGTFVKLSDPHCFQRINLKDKNPERWLDVFQIAKYRQDPFIAFFVEDKKTHQTSYLLRKKYR